MIACWTTNCSAIAACYEPTRPAATTSRLTPARLPAARNVRHGAIRTATALIFLCTYILIKRDEMNRFTDLKDKILPLLRPYVKRISVFGSFARGEETQDSDIDLLVELKSPENRPRLGLGWFKLEDELSGILGREVELVAEGSLSPYLRPYAEKDLVLIYEER